jgi:hypothetical protein
VECLRANPTAANPLNKIASPIPTPTTCRLFSVLPNIAHLAFCFWNSKILIVPAVLTV